MKKNLVKFFGLLTLSLSLVMTGCNGKKKPEEPSAPVVSESTESGSYEEEEYESYAAPVAEVKPGMTGVMISGWYYLPVTLKDGSVTMEGNFEAIVGTEVDVFGSYDPNDENGGAEMMKDVVVDGQKKNFIHIKYDGEEYWVRDYAVAVNADAAIVSSEKSDTYLYTKPDLSNMGSRIVPGNTIVAVFRDGPENGKFEKIRYYVPDGKTYTVNGYLPSGKVDADNNKVLAVQCINKYNSLVGKGGVDEAVLDELIENASMLGISMDY
jgi:hypothetical protein